MTQYLTVQEAAERVHASKSLIQAKCKDGSLPSIRIGKSYRILLSDLDRWVQHTPTRTVAKEVSTQSDVLSHIDAWHRYMEAVKAYSPDTTATHQKHLRGYLRRLTAKGKACSSLDVLFDRQSLVAVLSSMSGSSYYSKLNTYCALVTFGVYLAEEGRLDKAVLEGLRSLKPRQQSEPRRTHLKANEVGRFFDVVYTRTPDNRDNLTIAALAGCMVYGGLRASEVCNLEFSDVDLANAILTVRLGKGGKIRRVGISRTLKPLLEAYLRVRPKGSSRFFLDPDGEVYHRNKLGKRIKVVSQRLGVDITCHGLRRTFATLAANQGRSINSIRIALGHSNLETTQQYLRTSEAEVVEQMKDW